MIKVGIIGGSGLEKINGIDYKGEINIDTVYGNPSSSYKEYSLGNCNFYILSRHGLNHNIPPHKVNYRANIAGFKKLGVTHIVAFSAVGSLNKKFQTGSLLLPDNAIDFTKNRVNTFFDDDSCVHIDLTYPFCKNLRETILEITKNKNINIFNGGTYLCTEGPRFETAAEIKMYSNLGADVIGMTLFPEVSLIREAEICYSSINIVTNLAAGIEEDKKLTMDEVSDIGSKSSKIVCSIIQGLSEILPKERTCQCKDALKGALA